MALRDTDPERLRLGEGSISAALSAFLGLLALGGVLCLRFPSALTTPELWEHLPVAVARRLVQACLGLAMVLGLVGLLRRQPRGALLGLGASLAALALGGGGAPLGPLGEGGPRLSLDWLLLDLLALSLLFVPLELFLPQRRTQTKFHAEWRTDLAYFAVSHLFVLAVAVAVQAPAVALFGALALDGLQGQVSTLPLWVQLPLALFVADLTQALVHRAFHRVPWLWRFHAVHHSIRTVDWMAGSRLHLVDILVTRAATFVPLYALGFSPLAFGAYVVIVALQAVLAHANTRLPLGWLEPFLVTPRYHHWHHAADPAAHDRNFAIHLPLVDRLLGTHRLPPGWPERFGLEGEEVPRGYLSQALWPLRRG